MLLTWLSITVNKFPKIMKTVKYPHKVSCHFRLEIIKMTISQWLSGRESPILRVMSILCWLPRLLAKKSESRMGWLIMKLYQKTRRKLKDNQMLNTSLNLTLMKTMYSIFIPITCGKKKLKSYYYYQPIMIIGIMHKKRQNWWLIRLLMFLTSATFLINYVSKVEKVTQTVNSLWDSLIPQT